MISADVKASGPIFDGRMYVTIRGALPDIEKRVAQEGVDFLLKAPGRQLTGAPFKKPTGFYRMHIGVTRKGLHYAMHDHGVIYGAWLAGVSSRNAKSRFKGYAHWRRAVQHLMKEGVRVANQVIAERLRRLS